MNENDYRTVLGKTLGSLVQECCLNDIGELSPSLVKKKCRYYSVPELEDWRIPLVRELLCIQDDTLTLKKISQTLTQSL